MYEFSTPNLCINNRPQNKQLFDVPLRKRKLNYRPERHRQFFEKWMLNLLDLSIVHSYLIMFLRCEKSMHSFSIIITLERVIITAISKSLCVLLKKTLRSSGRPGYIVWSMATFGLHAYNKCGVSPGLNYFFIACTLRLKRPLQYQMHHSTRLFFQHSPQGLDG